MRLSGIDPSIIRELSGIYRSFPKAFKELVSNSFDADANAVEITFNEKERRLVVDDDGSGMTAFEFYQDFTKIGGSEKALTAKCTPSGRPRIGCKGIGFLAVARYCGRMVVRTHAARIQSLIIHIEPSRARIELAPHLPVL